MGSIKRGKKNVAETGWMTSMRTITERIFFWFPATGWRTSMGTTEETKFSLR
jgi:hypothetical protein